MNFKKIGKAVLCRLLEAQVRKLRQDNKFYLIAIAGSVGKTSTKLAIANTLASISHVIFQDGNYNDRLTVPLILFGQDEPGIFNVLGWIRILLNNQRQLRHKYPYDVAVVELGTDGPNQLDSFAYLHPDLSVITAIAPEHMEYFSTLDAVAREELSPLQFSNKTLINIDDIPPNYLPKEPFISYGSNMAANYKIIKRRNLGLASQQLTLQLADGDQLSVEVPLLGDSGARIVMASAAVAHLIGKTTDQIAEGLQKLSPVAGRMQILTGKQNSILIDDTYNASPTSSLAALEVLLDAEATQRIAVFGSMNELGTMSAQAHKQVGAACIPNKIDLLVTIGSEAENFLAPAARAEGCNVKSFKDPLKAGLYVEQRIKKGAVILLKGSQNGVFAEEAVKVLLDNPADASKLVRQSPYWLKVKQRQFPDLRPKAI